MPRVGPVDRSGLASSMAATPIMEGIPSSRVESLASRGALHVFEHGTYLLHQGDPSPEVHFLWRGRVDISSLSATGQRQLHATLDPPQFFGELGVLGDMPRTTSAIAVEDATVWTISGQEFLGFLEREPRASLALLRALARQIQAHEDLIDDLLFLDLKGRVAKRLLGLVSASFDELPEDGVEVPSIVTHADLAGLSGGSRENVTRILSELQRRDMVSRNGKRYVLKDVKGLARLAGL